MMEKNAPLAPIGKSAYVDTFVQDNLPPKELWPRIDFSSIPALAACHGQLNAASLLLDKHVKSGHGMHRAIY